MNRIIYPFYGVSLLLFVLFSYAYVDQNFFYLNFLFTGLYSQQRIFLTAIFTAFIILFFGFYTYFLKVTITPREFKNLLFLTLGILLFSYPAMLSFDIFNYATTSKVLFYYLENPYKVMPIEFINEPFLAYTRAANKVALYGPSWILLSGIPYVLGLGNYLLTLINFKILIVLFYVGTLRLLFFFSRKIYPLILFGLNPLVIIETIVGGHNDIVMIFFVLLSFYFLDKKKIVISFIFIIVSILIKFATIILLPVWLYGLWMLLKKEKINWNKFFLFSSIGMIIIFFLSPLREEMYPWYFIWVLPFISLISHKRLISLCILFSFVLLLRYIPYLATGNYFGYTPIIRESITFLPLGGYFIYLFSRGSVRK